MEKRIDVQNRGHYIEIATALSQCFKQNADKKWFVGLDGDINSGKELFAIACDKVFRPKGYAAKNAPDGIARNKNSIVLHPMQKPLGKPVVFVNYADERVGGKAEYDAMLEAYDRVAPKAKVLLFSRLLHMQGEDWLEKGRFEETRCEDSDYLDLHVHVTFNDRSGVRPLYGFMDRKAQEGFRRNLVLWAPDDSVLVPVMERL